MKTTFLVPMLVCGVAMAAACSDTKEPDNILPAPDGTQYSETFVQQYLSPSAIRLIEIPMASDDPSVRCIHIAFDGQEYSSGSDRFDALSAAYGDTYFNNRLVPYTNLALAEPIETVAVQWTAVGATQARPLNQGTRLGTASPFDFIRNGYRDQGVAFPAELSVLGCYRQYGYRPVFKPVSDLTTDDLTLIAYKDCYLFIPVGDLAAGGTLNVSFRIGSASLTATLDLTPGQ